MIFRKVETIWNRMPQRPTTKTRRMKLGWAILRVDCRWQPASRAAERFALARRSGRTHGASQDMKDHSPLRMGGMRANALRPADLQALLRSRQCLTPEGSAEPDPG